MDVTGESPEASGTTPKAPYTLLKRPEDALHTAETRLGSEGSPFKGGQLAMMLLLLSAVALAKIEIRAMDHDVQEVRPEGQ